MRTARQNFFLILSLGILNALTPFSIDLYLPAFPQIAGELGVAAARMSLTVSVYFIGYAFGQILYGPLLDRFGRKPPLYAGLLVYLAATIGCMNAQSFDQLVAFRLMSALGGCAASVAAMSMVRDYFPAKDGSRIFSMLMLVLSISPLLAPTLGGLLLGAFGWRHLFTALAGLAVLDLALVAFVLPSAYVADRRVSLRLGPLFHTYREIFRVPQFRRYTFAGSLSFAGLFVFVAGSPALFMGSFGLSARQFGGVFAILAGGMVIGGQLNHLLSRVAESRTIFRRALYCQIGISSLFLVGMMITGGLGLVPTVLCIFLALTCSGITYPHAASLALEPFTKNIGSGSALLGFLQLGLGSVAAALVGMLDAKGALPMAATMAVCSVLGGWILRSGSRDTISNAT